MSVNDFNNTYQIKELKILSDNSLFLFKRIMGLVYIIIGFFFYRFSRKKTTQNREDGYDRSSKQSESFTLF